MRLGTYDISLLLGPRGRVSSALLNGLMSYWKMDEASDGSVGVVRADSVGSNHLTDNNTVASAVGISGNAASFVAANSEQLGGPAETLSSLNGGDFDFTVSAWIKFASKSANMQVMARRGSNANREWDLPYETATDRLVWHVGDGAATQVGNVSANNLGSPSVGVWYFVVAWHDAVNDAVGIQVNNGTPNTAATTGAAGGAITAIAARIGAKNNTPIEFWDGLIDEAAFWKRMLTADERTELYNAGAGKFYPF